MKKFILIFAAVLVASIAQAALDVYTQVTVKTIVAPVLATGVETNAAVDVYDAKGKCNLIVAISAAGTNAVNFGASATLKTCATAAGTYAAVSGAVATCTGYAGTGTVTSIAVDASKLSRYVKLFTVSTNDTCSIGAVLLYSK